MAFDETLVGRVRELVAGRGGFGEKRMFGGITFFLNGNMCCGVMEDRLIVRLGAEAAEAALAEPHVRPFDMTGRPMKNWAMVGPQALEDDTGLARWVDEAAAFAASLPAK